ncbi:MAG: MFS transporter [Bacteroides sp.]|nr:MFS transporter [Bacteroides sp.]
MGKDRLYTSKTSAWKWIPSLYFAEGLPYVAVITISTFLYKELGLSNTEIALYTSWLYLPWTIKSLWSPFVDLLKTKRWWIVSMQTLIAASMAGIAFFIPTPFYVQATLACFWLIAFGSATHDISADGFYMIGLSEGEQSFFVGIRNTFYRFAMIFGQGILVMLAGWIENKYGNIQLAWSLVFYLMAGIFIALALYHNYILPRPAKDCSNEALSAKGIWEDFVKTFTTFFQKKEIGFILFFLLTYRLGEAQLTKMASLFLLDDNSVGGLDLGTSTVGFIYGTIGVIGLLLGGIVSGILVSRDGFKRWLIPMALAINLPDLLYVFLAITTPQQTWIVGTCVAIEQFGYGFGFTACTLYLIYIIADNPKKTAHYAIGTGIMLLGLMIPGMPAGWIQEHIGYTWFFAWVCLCTTPGIIVSTIIRKSIPEDFGKLNHKP